MALVLAVMLAGFPGCGQQTSGSAQPPENAPASKPEHTSAPKPERTPVSEPDGSRPSPGRPPSVAAPTGDDVPLRVPARRNATVRWDEATRWGLTARALTPSSSQRNAWGAVRLPILVTPAALEHGTATGERNWYAISARFDSGTLYITGGTIETVLPEFADSQEPTLDAPRLTMNELIGEAEWSAFGAHYALSFECDRPSDDTRCADTRYVASLVRELGLVQLEVAP